MTKTIIAAIAVLAGVVSGCEPSARNMPYKIWSKEYKDAHICNFWYRRTEYEFFIETQDSCHKYNIGDTITFK